MVVNGERIAAERLWAGREQELAEKAAELSPHAYETYLAERAAVLINDRIAEALLYQVAKLRSAPEDAQVLDRFVEDHIRRIISADFDGVVRRYEKHLESQGQTLEEVKENIRREMIITRYFESEIRPKIAEPTRADLLAAFEEAAETWRKPARRSMSLIDVRILDRLPAENTQPSREELTAARAAARARIEAAQRELQGGAAFADVARSYSDGLSASEGGRWGWVKKESVRERFEPAVAALAGLSQGEVSGIVEAEDGFFLVRCDELEPSVEPDFQTAQPIIRERYQRAVYQRMMAERVRELRAKARIEPADLSRFHAAVVAAAPKRAAGHP